MLVRRSYGNAPVRRAGRSTVRYARAAYVLHCFEKKSTHGIATPKPDMELIEARLKVVAAREKE